VKNEVIDTISFTIKNKNGSTNPQTTVSARPIVRVKDRQTSVPEPSSLVLAGTAALAGLGAWARRCRAVPGD